jgi:hypothetical protein
MIEVRQYGNNVIVSFITKPICVAHVITATCMTVCLQRERWMVAMFEDCCKQKCKQGATCSQPIKILGPLHAIPSIH